MGSLAVARVCMVQTATTYILMSLLVHISPILIQMKCMSLNMTGRHSLRFAGGKVDLETNDLSLQQTQRRTNQLQEQLARVDDSLLKYDCLPTQDLLVFRPQGNLAYLMHSQMRNQKLEHIILQHSNHILAHCMEWYLLISPDLLKGHQKEKVWDINFSDTLKEQNFSFTSCRLN